MKGKLILTILTMLLLAAVAAWAAEITSATATPSSITVTAGTTTEDAFTASINSISGKVPSTPPGTPQITYCSEWTIHSDGSVSCTATSTFNLTPGRNYTQIPVTAGEYSDGVTVIVDAGAPCTPPNNVYTLNETFTSNAGSGVDFGGGVLQVTRVVTVTVECAEPTASEGCSHGYWKNHTDAWAATAYSTDETLSAAGFQFPAALSGVGSHTMLASMKDPNAGGYCKGGPAFADKVNELLCQAVAALLNADHPDVNYPRTVGQVLTSVNSTIAAGVPGDVVTLKDALDADNNLTCPLGDPDPE